MNAVPQNSLEAEGLTFASTTAARSTGAMPASNRDALQALLAFAALQQQIRAQQRPGISGRESEHGFALGEALQLVAERALATTKADGVAIALAEKDAILCRAAAGNIAPDTGAKLNPKSGFSGACLSSGTIVRCDDSNHDPRVNPVICRQLGSRSMVAIPLLARQNVIGLIEAFAVKPGHFTDLDVRRLTLLAELILAAIRPEEEDRMAEIARRVVGRTATVEPIRRETPRLMPEPRLLSPQPEVIKDGEAEVEIIAHAADRRIPKPRHELAAFDSQIVQPSRKSFWLTLLLIVLVTAVASGIYWRSANQKTAGAHAGNPSRVSVPASPAAKVALPSAADNSTGEASLPAHTSGLVEVTGIRHWSSSDSSTVVIDLQDQVQYEAHRLSNPERIYFDLHDTKLSSTISPRTDVGDALLLRVRTAESTPGVTRVVLETKTASNFSVSLEQNPYRLVVEVRSLTANPQPRAKVELFGPSNPPIAAQPVASAAVASSSDAKTVATAPKFRIVLDAGHGGWDLGTVGRKGLLEKDLVLDLVGRLGKLVETKLGAEVVYTRTDDTYVALEKRTELANLAHANLFLSVHANYSDYPSARGVETYYTNTYSSLHAHTADAQDSNLQNVSWTNVNIREKVDESRRLAASVQQSLYRTLAVHSDIPNRGVKEASYVVLTGTTMPAVLTEVSFVSSPTDETNLQSSTYRQQIAEALYQGIARYVEASHRVSVASAAKGPITTGSK